MLRFLRIERPTTATLRPHSTATSAACCMRWMFDANEATRIRPLRTGMSVRNASPTSRSEPVMPGRSALVESPSRRSTPRLPISASLPTSVLSPSTGVWSSFQSPVWRTRPAGVSTTIATASGIEWATRTNSRRNPPSSSGGPSGSASTQLCDRGYSVLLELGADETEREPRRDHALDRRSRAGRTEARRRGPRGRASGRRRARGAPRGTRSPAGRGRRPGARRAGTRARRR